MLTSLENPHSSRKWDTILIESPLSLVNTQQRLTSVSHNRDDQNSVCSIIVDCQQLTQTGNYSHGYIGADGNKDDTYKGGCMSEIKAKQ